MRERRKKMEESMAEQRARAERAAQWAQASGAAAAAAQQSLQMDSAIRTRPQSATRRRMTASAFADAQRAMNQ